MWCLHCLPTVSCSVCYSGAVSTFNLHTPPSLSLFIHMLALPTALASLLPSAHSDFTDLLASIEAVSVGVVCLEYKGQPLPADYREVGKSI